MFGLRGGRFFFFFLISCFFCFAGLCLLCELNCLFGFV